VLLSTVRAFFPNEKVFGLTHQALSRVFLVVISLLTAEQFIASVLIAPKHRFSAPRKSPDTAMLGLKLYLLGIGVQEIIVAYTILLAFKFVRNTGGSEAEYPQNKASDETSPKWRVISYSLILSLAAIATRIAYRLVELSGIFTGYLLVLMHNEVFFYVLECLPVLFALGVWTFVDTQGLLDLRLSSNAPGDAYSYHEIGRELTDGETVRLQRVSVDQPDI
jgi:hypothetical protein